MTRQAYGLDRIVEQEFPADETLDARALERNAATIKNIRLWDYRPLLRTYAQLQEIRTYYKFIDVDNDRYPSTASTVSSCCRRASCRTSTCRHGTGSTST